MKKDLTIVQVVVDLEIQKLKRFKCGKCGELKKPNEFSKHSGRKNGLQSQCKICKKETDQKFYKENRAYYYNYNKDHRNKLKQITNDYKSIVGCQKCSERHPICLEFHHIQDKVLEIGKAVNGWSENRLMDEINKCIVLCSNCHRKLHMKEKLKQEKNMGV